MHNLYLSHLVEIADGSRHAIAIKQNLCYLLRSACLYTTVNSWIGILTLQLMLLPTQLAFLNRCAGSTCFFLGVIHKIFQVHLGASYPRLSWQVKSYGNLMHAACGYRVKLRRQGYTARCTTDDIYLYISWKIAVEQTSVGLAHACPNWASTSSSEAIMWRLCWLQLLCHHCISSVQGLDYTKFSLRLRDTVCSWRLTAHAHRRFSMDFELTQLVLVTRNV